jgi:hypothetical protein
LEDVIALMSNDSSGLDERIDEAKERRSDIIERYRNHKTILEAERQLALSNLDMRFEEELDILENEWNSEQTKAKYNKVPPSLITMRQQVQAMMTAHHFEEARELALDIEKAEREEVKRATKRMNREYELAQMNLKSKFLAERQVLEDSYDLKLLTLKKGKAIALRPFEQTISKLEKQKEKRVAKLRDGPLKPLKKVPVKMASRGQLSLTGKLRLPAVRASWKGWKPSTTGSRLVPLE